MLIAQREPVRGALSGRCSQHTARFPSVRSGFVKHVDRLTFVVRRSKVLGCGVGACVGWRRQVASRFFGAEWFE